jgi:hypothetical protein
MGWLSNRLPTACAAWLINDVLACRFLAVVWLKRGANASRPWNKACPAAVIPASRKGWSWRQ